MSGKPGRPGGARKGGKKGPTVGTGGNGRRALEGKGPTPKAEDRSWHVAGKRKLAQDRLEAARARHGKGGKPDAAAPARRRTPKRDDDSELLTGRNSVLEALRTKVPATTLYIATRIEMDDRVKESIALATKRGIPLVEIMRPELDRKAGHDAVHQGIALAVPPYQYAHPLDLVDDVIESDKNPLFVALDGVTDPRNLGAIIRSVGAFGGQGVIVPQRRSVGVTASAWKTSAGAAARVPVALASNLAQTIDAIKDRGVFVIGLDGDGDVSLPGLELANRPLLVVTGSEGKGLSRLITEKCDAIVSIPISSVTESLNAGIATSVTLYEIAKLRAER
ncbi:23S rRNA (guanosine(2251)-2'-O)-methyltransferase RlmB [Schumannella soli]|uniref:23S rRNA (Guanosine(2251)-2'-O)-methyltransferase RlmB n=1 Tax=Schumannella soli TaxID=2590779 RepID=A0A506Y0X0_9MICO|nr:23S rRNA (guanosine(2251)-2'-O)-methyltransferase RlmB [Schumannella soli]TPW75543.1 23S rRNA (guanosine(2251)-2'-O)-methyltransferase RlmB [Schumannella soli]